MADKTDVKDIAKKALYAGVGAVAVIAEATGNVVVKLAEKGEQVANDSKVINDGKKAVKDLKENMKKSQATKTLEALAGMTQEERDAIRRKLDEVEEALKETECGCCDDEAPECCGEESCKCEEKEDCGCEAEEKEAHDCCCKKEEE